LVAHAEGISDLEEELKEEEGKKGVCSCEIGDEVEGDSCD
jgi:hypothetical protein